MLQAYGEIGVRKIIDILEREITTNMRLMGVSRIADLTPDLVRVESCRWSRLLTFIQVERVDWQPIVRPAKL